MASLYLLLVSASIFISLAAAADYGYTGDIGPDKWGDLSPAWAACGIGKAQSPIDIVLDQSSVPLGPLDFQYPFDSPKPALFYLDTHNAKAELDSSWGSLEVGGVVYYPDNVHFHTPSEHTIGGKSYPLEVHLVHTTADGQHNAVVGILYELGPNNNTFLDQFLRYVPLLEKYPTARISIPALSAEGLGISLESPYWRYPGSLTTPPCTEGLVWTVPQEIAEISQSQLDAYHRLRPAPNNRPVQSLNGRKISGFSLYRVCGLKLATDMQ